MSHGMTAESEPTISPRETPSNDSPLARWQARLLPLMQGTIVTLAVFFFVATGAQLLYLHQRIDRAPTLNVMELLPAVPPAGEASPQERLAVGRLRAAIALEATTVERRHHHASVALMSQLWVRYLGVITGVILAVVGAVFILGKLQERFSEVRANVAGAEGSLKSSSPGVILVVLGTALVLATVLDHREMSVNDAPVYMSPGAFGSTAEPGPATLPPRNPAGR